VRPTAAHTGEAVERAHEGRGLSTRHRRDERGTEERRSPPAQGREGEEGAPGSRAGKSVWDRVEVGGGRRREDMLGAPRDQSGGGRQGTIW